MTAADPFRPHDEVMVNVRYRGRELFRGLPTRVCSSPRGCSVADAKRHKARRSPSDSLQVIIGWSLIAPAIAALS